MLPGDLDHVVARWLQAQDGATRRANSGELTEKYRRGQNSGNVDLAAYLTTRMPATYAALSRVLEEVANTIPNFSPQSMLDIGAGPGTASWAALSQWPELARVSMIEADVRFSELAKLLAQQSNIAALATATIVRGKLNEMTAKAYLVIAAYVFAELPEKDAGKMAFKLWEQTEHTLIVIEPGTPRGFARIKAARDALINAGANIIGPCTHANACPMSGDDWCHFVQRLSRSREHMHAKGASAPFEDENFSWIAASRYPVKTLKARVLARPETSKHDIKFKLCTENGLYNSTIARRDKAAYKRYRKLAWGDAVDASPEN